MMAASLLHRGVSVLKGCPAIADVYCMEDILRSLGALTWWEKIPFILTAAERTEQKFPETVPENAIIGNSSGCASGKEQKGSMGYPGGCVIGKRPVDQHLYVLRCLGAWVEEKENSLEAEAGCLKGAEIVLENQRRRYRAGGSGRCPGRGAYGSQKLCQRAGNRVAVQISSQHGS